MLDHNRLSLAMYGLTSLLFAKTNCNRVYSLNVALRFYIPISHNRENDSGVQ